jgi:CheY-like chemotaxis protein
MQEKTRRVVVSASDDLFFSAKIASTAGKLPVTLTEVRDAVQLEHELEAGVAPDLVILDLNSEACRPLASIRKIKADPRLQATRLVGFLSHVQKDLHQHALEAGCDAVLPRSRFSADLAEILAGTR